MEYEVLVKDRKMIVEVSEDKIFVDGQEMTGKISQLDLDYYVHDPSKVFKIRILEEEDQKIRLSINGKPQEVFVKDHLSILLEKLGMSDQLQEKALEIKAPMPGSILDIMVEDGMIVEPGQPLLILEAMKMENLIKAPGEATIKRINVSKGDNVEKNAILIEFE